MFNFFKNNKPKKEPQNIMQPLIDATIRWKIDSEYRKQQEEVKKCFENMIKAQEEIIKIHETTIEKQKQLIAEQKEQIAILQEITSLYEKKDQSSKTDK